MATWYDKNGTDMTMILDPREGAGREVGFSDLSWNECRIGWFVSATVDSADNTAWLQDTVAVSSVYDNIMMGLKNSDYQDTLVGEANCQFWGIKGKASDTSYLQTDGVLTSYGNTGGGGYGLTYCASSGATVNVANVASQNIYVNDTTNAVAATNYAMFFGLQFIISNRGTASQTVEIYSSTNGTTRTSDTSKSALKTLLTNFSSHRNGTSSGSLTANTGAAAYTVPDAVYMRIPFNNARLRIHNVMALYVS